ncbi:Paraneoplastic antigen Ma1 [Merluccius polli]|uniref:Paraneoplastic antigen Ma1 n=1 Tax=Merluccius polli TaxID=89951 RepID=A0AA47M0X4_MERPO|nr:Paraneoplastic antigen Ma1 [Merluccius polli]
MSQISDDIETIQPVDEASPSLLIETSVETPQPDISEVLQPHSFADPPLHNTGLGATASIPLINVRRTPSLSVSDINPPEIQKVVVEHIVRRENIVPHLQSPVRLRSFSGKTPRPNNEPDYIGLLVNDPSMSRLQISRRILESLLSPAADIVKGLSPESPPVAYLQLLDSAFGTVEDGEELFAQFMNTLQDPGEKAIYLPSSVTASTELSSKKGRGYTWRSGQTAS